MYSCDKLKKSYDDIIEQRSQLINFNSIIGNRVNLLNNIYKDLLSKNLRKILQVLILYIFKVN